MIGLVARAGIRHFARDPWQLALAGLGIALGVSLAVGIEVATTSVRRAFALSSEAVTGRATHQILGGPSGVDESLYRRLRLADDAPAGVELAPLIVGAALPDGGGGALQILGVDPLAEGAFRGAEGAVVPEPAGAGASSPLTAFLVRPGTAILSLETATALGVAPGGTFWVRAGGRRHALTAVEIRALTDARQKRALDRVALVDISTAQELLAMPGRLSRIDVILPPAAAQARAEGAALAWLRARLPVGTRLEAAAGRQGALAQMTRAFDLNLRALSLLALLVGAFLIYNTMSFSVVRRRTTFVILRTLGATRGQLGVNLLLEALVLGVAGSAVGVALGVLMSRGLVRLIARAVSDLYFAVSVGQTVPLPTAPLLGGFALGVLAALVSAWPAARDAIDTAPSIARQRSPLEQRARRRTPRLAALSAALIVLAAVVLAFSGRSLAVGLAALLALLVGCAGLVPGAVLLAARGGAFVLGGLRGATGRLAARGLSAGLSRTGVATAALTLALAVATGVAVMVSSFRGAVEQWLSGTLRADVYVSAPSSVGARADSPLPRVLLARLRRLPGVAGVGTNRIVTVPVSYRSALMPSPTLLMAIDLPPGRDLGVELLQGRPAAAAAAFSSSDDLLVSEPLAYKRGLAAGDQVTMQTDRGSRAFKVAGVYRDYGSDAGAMMISRATYDRFFEDRLVTGIAMHAGAGISAEQLVARVRATLGAEDAVVVRSSRALRESSMQIFDRTFEVTSVLRLIALLVAILGITSALMALGLERVRELATLRALGATPAQIVEVTMVETGLLGGLAGLLAIPLGLVLAAALVFVINQRSFGWTMPLSPGVWNLVSAPLLGAAAGIAAGIYPAWRASRVVPAQALREE